MSVNSTVASTRVGSTLGFAPIRNASTASSTSSGWPQIIGRLPGSSTSLAPGMCSAR
jgi:hypothetical protein